MNQELGFSLDKHTPWNFQVRHTRCVVANHKIYK